MSGLQNCERGNCPGFTPPGPQWSPAATPGETREGHGLHVIPPPTVLQAEVPSQPVKEDGAVGLADPAGML